MPGSDVDARYTFTHLILALFHEVGILIIPIFQVSRLRQREAMYRAQGHVACKQQSWDLNPVAWLQLLLFRS